MARRSGAAVGSSTVLGRFGENGKIRVRNDVAIIVKERLLQRDIAAESIDEGVCATHDALEEIRNGVVFLVAFGGLQQT